MQRWPTAFATGVLPYIYAFHRYTWSSVNLSRTLARQFPRLYGVEPHAFTMNLNGRLRTLYAQ